MKNILSETIHFFSRQWNDITGVEKTLEILDPANVLKRGYSITLANGKVLKSVGMTGAGTALKTIIADGHIISTVNSVSKNETND